MFKNHIKTYQRHYLFETGFLAHHWPHLTPWQLTGVAEKWLGWARGGPLAALEMLFLLFSLGVVITDEPWRKQNLKRHKLP